MMAAKPVTPLTTLNDDPSPIGDRYISVWLAP